MQKQSLFHVKKRTLLAIAGCVWMIAGFGEAPIFKLGIAFSGKRVKIKTV